MPQEVVGDLEVGADSEDLVDQVLDTDDAELAESLLDDLVGESASPSWCSKKKIKDNPETRLNFPDFSRLCGQKWQAMNEVDREIYETKANEVIKSLPSSFTVICGKSFYYSPG